MIKVNSLETAILNIYIHTLLNDRCSFGLHRWCKSRPCLCYGLLGSLNWLGYLYLRCYRRGDESCLATNFRLGRNSNRGYVYLLWWSSWKKKSTCCFVTVRQYALKQLLITLKLRDFIIKEKEIWGHMPCLLSRQLT